MPRHGIRAHYEQQSEFERGRIIGLKEGVPITPTHCQARLQWRLAQSGRNHVDWVRIVFSDESCFQLCPDDHRRRVWRRPGQRANPAFNIVRYTGPEQGVMIWGAISFETGPLWSSLEAHLQHIGTSTAF
ncbi:transposable element Tc1 transposase [Trichonephila clavipes]|nr:transposable element Tc1 transposase [Trichonephila clavipes]